MDLLRSKNVSIGDLFNYMKSDFIQDYQEILSQKLSLIFTKITSIYIQDLTKEQRRSTMIQMLSNKKNKFPWTLDEVQVALQNVLKNFN